SLFKENHLLLGFFHKTLYVLIKREKQSAVFPFCKPFSSVQGTPFDWFPYGLRATKASRRPPPIPPQPIQGAKPLENPPKR
ncbi:MAG: hypothetical protein U0I48_12730, partial [Acutalibacteraceae bacterium]|nr:hypothetical protein [Acutalibacteraceae bacterium]